jgi:NitT/TauT family transport system ATP-binding protein
VNRTDPAVLGQSADAASAGQPLLDIRGLNVTYASSRGPVHAISDLTLQMQPGEFVCALGPSGCGKTTLLGIIAGMVRPTSGTVLLKGTPVTGPRPDVGFVFQQPTLLPWSTVLENVLVPIRNLNRPVGEYRDKAEALIRMVGLTKFLHHYPHELSGGMQQRVGLARALVHDPKLLLMDEPFAALDAMTRERMSLELQRIWSETKTTVLFITHSIPEAVFLSDRILVMSASPGRIVEDQHNPLARPRTLETMVDPDFAQRAHMLRQFFKHTDTDV